MMAHNVVEPLIAVRYISQCESIKPVSMSHHPRSRAPRLVHHLTVRSTQLDEPNTVKIWHKSAPLLITVVTILGLIVILHH
jgi:hypothetical protein